MNSEIEDARTKANQWFKNLENKINKKDPSNEDFLKTDFLVTDKSIPHAIVKYAEDHDIDLTVVGTQGRSGLTRMVLGSVASSVVTYSSCPVLIIR
jgi:nucleotide-binding universal stress UspA family protein